MAKKFYTDINLLRNELQNAAIQNLAEAPENPVLGQIYFRTTDNEVYICVNTEGPVWESMGGDIEEVIAGLGLTGGGSDGSVTLNIGQGTGITINDDDIQIRNADSLTENKLAKWDSVNGQLTDSIIINTGNYVGINNDTPEHTLDVSGSTKIDGVLYLENSSFGQGPKISTTSSLQVELDSDRDTETAIFQVGGKNASPTLVASENGNVGIGLNGFESLHIFQETPNIKIHNQENNGEFFGIEFAAFNNGVASGLFSGSIKLESQTKELRTFLTTDYFQTFYTNGTEAMRIDINGYVGIGTETPAKELHVAGELIVDDKIGVNTTSPAYPIDVNGDNIRVGLHTIGAGASTQKDNIAIGEGSMTADAGDGSLALGKNSLNVSTGLAVVGLGEDTLRYSPDASYALSVGTAAGMRDNGTQNVFVGPYSGPYNTELTGIYNTFLGAVSGIQIGGTSERNTALGNGALYVMTEANNNTAVGQGSLYTLTTGSNNTALGHGAGNGLTTGSDNIFIGRGLTGIETGSYNVIIGKITGLATDLSNTIILADGESNERMRITSVGRVGIGTAIPGTALHVRSSGFAQIRIDGDSISSLEYFSGANKLADIYATTAKELIFRSNGSTEQMRIRSNGRVGIGTSSPQQKLHVAGDFIVSDGLNDVNVFLGTANFGLKLYYTESKLSLRTNFADRMTIDINGNVGIGTVEPSERFHVVGNADIEGVLYIDNAQVQDDGRFRFGDDNDFSVGFNSADSTLKIAIGNSLTTTQAISIDGSGNLQFPQYTAGYLKSDASGNITVDADVVEDTLDSVTTRGNTTTNNITVGNITSTSGVVIMGQNKIDGGSDNLKIMSDSENVSGSSTIEFSVDGSEKMRIDTTGNLGIGTSNPAQKLEVSSATDTTISISSSDTSINTGQAIGILEFASNNETSLSQAYTPFSKIKGISESAVVGAGSVNGAITFETASANVFAERMRITSDGNVGIGTASPSEKLHVVGDTRIEGNLTVNGTYTQIDTDTQTTEQWNVTNDGTGPAVTINQTGAQDIMDVQDDGTSVFYIEDGGNVGIGTTNPIAKLDVDGDIAISNVSVFNKTGNVLTIGDISDADEIGFITLSTSNDSTVLHLDDTGYVGIGTTSPGQKLVIAGGTNGRARIQVDEGVNNYGKFEFSTSESSTGSGEMLAEITATITQADPLSLRSELGFSTNSGDSLSEKMKIASGGALKLNSYGSNTFTGTPAYALAVDSSGNVIETAVQGSPVGGSGTGNYLAKWETADTLTDSPIYDNGNDIGIGTTSPSEKLEVNGNVKANNFIGGNEAGIYTFTDTVDASTSEDIFSISNEHGAQAFRVTFVCNTSSYSVAKTFEVVHSFGNDPVFFKVVDTGVFGGHDFDVSFATEAGGATENNKKIICTITNNSTTINADITTTVFLGGSPTTITVTAL